MEQHEIVTNSELGQAYFYWESKHGRLFLASQVLKELGYKRSVTQLFASMNMVDGIDKIKFTFV